MGFTEQKDSCGKSRPVRWRKQHSGHVPVVSEEDCSDGKIGANGVGVRMATLDWIRIRARCELKTADRVLEFFDEIAELPDPERSAVGIAFREILTNESSTAGA